MCPCSAACERLPGGQQAVQDRLDALKDRLHHLYAVQSIGSQLRDAQLEDRNADPGLGDQGRVKKEGSDPDASEEMERMSLSSDQPAGRALHTPTRSQARAQPGSSPHTSSPGGHRRTFKDDIVSALLIPYLHMDRTKLISCVRKSPTPSSTAL